MQKRDNLAGLIIVAALLALLSIPTVIPVIMQDIIQVSLFVVSLYIAYELFQIKKLLSFLFGINSVVYNPITLFIQNTHSWAVIDIAVALTFFITALVISRPKAI
jgi:hypothetical protein